MVRGTPARSVIVYTLLFTLFTLVMLWQATHRTNDQFVTDTARDIILKDTADVSHLNPTVVNNEMHAHSHKCTPNLKHARYNSQSGEDKALYNRYFSSPPLCNGVYLEIGALDGLQYSNTIFYETSLNWTGILIEAQPQNAAKLKKNRKTSHNVIIPEAVCQEGQGHVNFTGSAAVGGVLEEISQEHMDHFFKGHSNKVIKVPCRPIGAMIKDAAVKHIDFFILDVEGAELMVLETMDWSVPVRVFVVEMGRGSKDDLLIDLLASKGYHKSAWDIRHHCPPKHDCANNQVFENANFPQM